MRIAIVASRFNEDITSRLLDGCVKTLKARGIPENHISVFWVPGAFEIPLIAMKMAKSKKFHAVICLGCILRGETTHDQYIATWTSLGIGTVSLQTGVPVIFGVITPLTEKQAMKRSGGKNNKGVEAAGSAIQMVNLLKKTSES